jgi:hypothetical protein
VIGVTVSLPATVGPGQSSLCCDYDRVSGATPFTEGPGYESLVVTDIVVVEAIHIRRIDQRHAGIQRCVDDTDRYIGGWPTI